MKDEEYRLFQLYIMDNPEKGDILKQIAQEIQND